jgi:hypothetical protein
LRIDAEGFVQEWQGHNQNQCQKINNVLDIAPSLRNPGQVSWQRGEVEYTRSLFLKSLAQQESLGIRQEIVECVDRLYNPSAHLRQIAQCRQARHKQVSPAAHGNEIRKRCRT